MVKNNTSYFKKTALWKNQYQPRIDVLKKVYPQVYKVFVKKSVSQQVTIIDNLQMKGFFGKG